MKPGAVKLGCVLFYYKNLLLTDEFNLYSPTEAGLDEDFLVVLVPRVGNGRAGEVHDARAPFNRVVPLDGAQSGGARLVGTFHLFCQNIILQYGP